MSRSAFRAVLPVAILGAACAALRLPGLTALPIFGDEAIFLRVARLMRESPVDRMWLAFQEANPPLHSWLLALCLPLSEDPLIAGRLLSVLLGALTVPAFFWLVLELFRGSGGGDPERPVAMTACLLLVFCPFTVLAQRMARVDALFLLESILVAVFSFRLARRPGLAGGAFLGLTMGVTMLTRQNVSYVLWALPVAAFLLEPKTSRPSPRRFLGALGLSLACGALLWIPMLASKSGPDLSTRLFHLEAVRESMPLIARLRLAGSHAGEAALWLWTYLTPPVALLAAVGFGWLALRRRGLFLILVAWLCVLLLPIVFFATVFFPRYVLPACAPLFCAAAWAIVELGDRIASRWRSLSAAPAVASLLLPVVLAWPAHDIYGQLSDWKTQKLASSDRWQFISGWPAGFATEKVVAHLLEMGRRAPTFVVTSPDSGNPPDTLWLRLEGKTGVALGAARALDLPLVLPDPVENGLVVFSGDPRRGEAAVPVRAPSGAPLLFVSREEIYTKEGLVRAEDHWRRFHPALHEVARFENPPYPDGRPGDAVVVLAIR